MNNNGKGEKEMTTINEKTRIYRFPNGEWIEVEDVQELEVSSSGGHRITTKTGKMYYIPFKWLAIEIESDHGWEM